MKSLSIFDFQNYKKFLIKFIESQADEGRGFRTKMADKINCQKSFITKVLNPNSKLDLSSEQAEILCSLMQFSQEEKKYFILLLQYNRASTSTLKQHWLDQMKEVLNRRLLIKEEQQSHRVISPEDHFRYYSSWHYSAIRIALSIPNLNTQEALANYFKLDFNFVGEILLFLINRGLIEIKGKHYFISKQSQIMLPSEHPLTNKHHLNWRQKVIELLDKQSPQDLHYSYLVSISEDDSLKIRSFLVEAIKEIIQRAELSPAESLYSISLDFIKL